jgi:hypothetical protein
MSSPTGPDWKSLLPQLLGQAGGLTGNRGFAKRWAELEQQKRQQGLVDSEEQRRQQDQQMQQQQLQMQQEAAQRAQEQQRMASLNSLRQLLDVNQVADMDEYAQREAFATRLAPTLGIDAGFIQSLRPNPTRFEVNEAKKMLAEIDKTYAPAQLAMLEQDDQTGSAPVFTLKSGKQMTVGQLRQLAGTQPIDPKTGAAVSMRVQPKTDVPNTSEEQQIADVIAIAEEQLGRPLTRGERAQARLRAVSAFRDAGRAPRAAVDPEVAELRKDVLRGQVQAQDDKRAADAQKLQAADAVTAKAKAAARRTSGDTLEVLNKLIAIGPDGRASLRPGVGNLFGLRVPFASSIPGTKVANVSAALERLKGRVVVDLIAEMKSQSRTGATGFGQLTERELGLLESAATVLSSANISNEVALEELVRIYNIAKQAYDGAAPVTSSAAPPTGGAPPPRQNPFRR